jgi:Holliday junction resolvase RusA-like endonuclease
MSLSLYFWLDGDAVGKGRPRVSTIGGRPRLYTPAKTAAWERQVADACQGAMGSLAPTESAWAVRIDISCRIPASWPRKRREAALQGREIPGKPDLDNVAKSVLDACNGVAYIDDKQVVRLTVSKRYGASPGIEVHMHEVID